MTAELRKLCLEAGLITPTPPSPPPTRKKLIHVAPSHTPVTPLPLPPKPPDNMTILLVLMHAYTRRCFVCGDYGTPPCEHREPNVELAIIASSREQR